MTNGGKIKDRQRNREGKCFKKTTASFEGQILNYVPKYIPIINPQKDEKS